MRKKLSYLCVILVAAATCLWARAPRTVPKPNPSPGFEYGPLKSVSDVAFSADGSTILAVGVDKPVGFTYTLWDIATGKSSRLITGPDNALLDAHSFTTDRRMLATGLESEENLMYWVTLWDTATGKTIRKLPGHEKEISSVAFSADGHTIAAGGQDDLLFVWDVATGKQLYEQSDNCWLDAVAFSPDGKTIVSECVTDPQSATASAPSGTDIIEFRDAATGNVLRSLPRQTPNDYVDIAYSPDGHTFLYTTEDNTITLSDASTGQVIRTINYATANADSGYIGPVVLSPDGKIIATASDDYAIKFWDVATGRLLHTLTGHSSDIHGIAFSADGKTLVSGSNDNTIKLWDIATGQLLKSFGTVNPPSAYGPQP